VGRAQPAVGLALACPEAGLASFPAGISDERLAATHYLPREARAYLLRRLGRYARGHSYLSALDLAGNEAGAPSGCAGPASACRGSAVAGRP